MLLFLRLCNSYAIITVPGLYCWQKFLRLGILRASLHWTRISMDYHTWIVLPVLEPDLTASSLQSPDSKTDTPFILTCCKNNGSKLIENISFVPHKQTHRSSWQLLQKQRMQFNLNHCLSKYSVKLKPVKY